MFIVYWKSNSGRFHKTNYHNDAFKAMRGFRSHKTATLVRNGVQIAQALDKTERVIHELRHA